MDLIIQKWFFYLLSPSLIFSIFIADSLVFLTSIFFLSSQIYKKNFQFFKTKYFKFFFIFWLYLIINSLFSYNISLSLSRSLPYIRFGILFLALAYMLNDESFKNYFLKITLFFLLFLCIDANFQFFFGMNILGYEAHTSRISSFFQDELVLGGFLLKMYPLFLISIIYLNQKHSFPSYISSIIILLYFFSLFLSGERTAFFNFLLLNIIISTILFRKKYIKKLLFFLIILPIIFIFTSKNNNDVLDRYLSIKQMFNNKTITVFSKTHENHYISAIEIYKSYPIVGSGLKTFRETCKKPQHNPIGCSTHPHNIFMLFLSELGSIGIIFYLIAFFYFGLKLTQLFFFSRNNILNNNLLIIVIIYASIFMNFWPFSPSGNFFNNWLSILNFLPLSFLIYYKKYKFDNKLRDLLEPIK